MFSDSINVLQSFFDEIFFLNNFLCVLTRDQAEPNSTQVKKVSAFAGIFQNLK